MVTGMDIDTEVDYGDDLCEPCELVTPLEHHGKTSNNKELVALARICIDIFQISPVGINGHKYGLLITDEGSGARWGFTFKHKSDAFEVIRDFNKYA